MRHTLSILLQSDPGALVRVAGLFAARNCPIESLTVAPTHDPAISRLTLVLHASHPAMEQIVRQIRKLIEVVDVNTLSLVRRDDSALLAVGSR